MDSSVYTSSGFANLDELRLSLFPIRKDEQSSWILYNTQEEASWAVTDVNLTDDKKHWPHLPPALREILTHLMAFFVVADRLVVFNLQNLGDMLSKNDLVKSMFLASQERIEGVHMHMYSMFVSSLIPDAMERNRIYNAVSNYESVRIKLDWMTQYLSPGTDLRVLLVANACAEGIFFSNAFGIALFPKTLGVMYGWCYGNEKVMADEFIHLTHAYTWYLELDEPLSTEQFHEIVKGSVDVEMQFAKDIMKDHKFPNLNAELLTNYAKYIADLVCESFGYPILYKIPDNPLPYMDLTALKGVTNFFERTVGEYSKISIDQAVKGIELNLDARV